MATVNLGRIKPIFKGAYAGGTAYVVDDIVTSGNETFICIQASTGNATSNASYWTKLAAKGTDGTNGTDVGTVITTQGDLLYRDGSGLQRLAKGTAGQALKMNTAANAPEWGTISSDWVKLGSGSGSNVSSVSVDFFSADYKIYKIFIYNWYSVSSNGTGSAMRFNTSGNNADSASKYRYIFDGYYWNNSGTNGDQRTGGWDSDKFGLSNVSSSITDSSDHEITVLNPFASDKPTTVIACGGGFEGNHIYSRAGHGVYDQNKSHTGVRFFLTNGGNIHAPHIDVYGIK